MELGLASRLGRLLGSRPSVEIPEVGSVIVPEIVVDSRGLSAIRVPVLLIKFVELNSGGIGGDNCDIVGAVDAVLRLDAALLGKISVIIIVSSLIGLVSLVLFPRPATSCAGIDVFNSAMGITLAGTGSIM